MKRYEKLQTVFTNGFSCNLKPVVTFEIRNVTGRSGPALISSIMIWCSFIFVAIISQSVVGIDHPEDFVNLLAGK